MTMEGMGAVAQFGWLGLRVGGRFADSLHSSSELLQCQWSYHGDIDSTVNIYIIFDRRWHVSPMKFKNYNYCTYSYVLAYDD